MLSPTQKPKHKSQLNFIHWCFVGGVQTGHPTLFVLYTRFILLLFQALDKAKEAGRKERLLMRQREALGGGEQANLDLTYSVCNKNHSLVIVILPQIFKFIIGQIMHLAFYIMKEIVMAV